MSIIIMVDGGANLSKAMLRKYGICRLPYNMMFKNGDCYKAVKNHKYLMNLINTYNEVPKVDQLSKIEIEKYFRKYINEGHDIIYIGASSLLTSSYNDVLAASKEFSSNNIAIIDSMNIGNGEAILALYAKDYIDRGYGFKQTIKYLNNIKRTIKSCYLVGNPKYLYRDSRCRGFYTSTFDFGYRVPILEINKGRLVMTLDAKESKLALQVLKNTLIDNKKNINNSYLLISYSGDKTNALKLKGYVNKFLEIDNIEVIEDNATVFTNIGDNSLSVAFLNNEL